MVGEILKDKKGVGMLEDFPYKGGSGKRPIFTSVLQRCR